ncbi:MAG: phasin family protein [Hyphomicrobiales bacterium]|nr:phasin family protein [Hyphomicrobiales bacterium]
MKKDITKTYADFAAFSKDYTDAILASSKAAAVGTEKFSSALMELGKASAERYVAQAQKIAKVTSPEAAFKVQSEFASEAFKQAVVDGKALFELSTKVTNDVAAPFTKQAKMFAGMFVKAA